MAVTLKVQVNQGGKLPTKANPTDACWDIYTPVGFTVFPGEFKVIASGIQLEIPEGYEVQVRGRSGNALKGLYVHPGTIDHLYRKELGVIMFNLGKEFIHFKEGDRIAQMALCEVPLAELVQGQVEVSDRGGFGSTGA